MTFKDLNLKTSYISSGDESIVISLIAPALKICKLYQRSVAFFSSSVFRLLIDSLPDFISNNGKIQLVISPTLSKEDVEAIELGYKTKEQIVKGQVDLDFSSEICSFEDDELKDSRPCVPIDMMVIDYYNVMNHYDKYKYERQNTTIISKEQFDKYLHDNFICDDSLLKVYEYLYSKEFPKRIF